LKLCRFLSLETERGALGFDLIVLLASAETSLSRIPFLSSSSLLSITIGLSCDPSVLFIYRVEIIGVSDAVCSLVVCVVSSFDFRTVK
jgi:hypothetical protein